MKIEMKRLLFLHLFIVIFYNCFCQSNNSAAQNTPKVIPPSPNAAAIEKFGSIPVDYSTGVPQISYPFWNWSRGKLSLNIGLSYHAGGHRVDEMASNVGLGWALNAGGRVSRTVRGLNDDDQIYGFMYAPYPGFMHTYQYDGEFHFVNSFVPDNISQSLMITKNNGSLLPIAEAIAKGERDGEQDIFSINIGGKSCRFVIDRQQTILPLEHTTWKISMQTNPVNTSNGSGGLITSFTVIDDNGLEYLFDKIETQSSLTYSDPASIPPPPSNQYTSG